MYCYSPKAPSALHRGNLKTEVSFWKCIKRFQPDNHQPFRICVWRNLKQGNHMIIVKPSFFEQLHFQNAFRLRENEKPAFSNFCSSKSVLENIRFHEGLLWMIDLTGEIKRCFQSVFCPRENEKPAFSNFCGSKNVLENIRFRDRSVWTDRPNRRNKAAFSNC